MSANDNAVNMPRGYHHGELRTALIAAGMAMLAERSADEVSLREIARRVGVSATAVYRHFPDKQALLAALALEGLDALAERQRAATSAAGGGLAGFKAMGVAYVTFAIANPALFRLAFVSAPHVDLLGDDLSQVGQAMRGLRETIGALMPAHLPEADRRVAALRAWAVVHGLAMLVLDGQIADDRALIERTICESNLF